MTVSTLLDLKIGQTGLGVKFGEYPTSYFINFRNGRSDIRIIDYINIIKHSEFKEYL